MFWFGTWNNHDPSFGRTFRRYGTECPICSARYSANVESFPPEYRAASLIVLRMVVLIKSLCIWYVMRIDEMTTKEFEKVVKNNPLVIIPLGATESHGSHLPLGTDTFQPEYVANIVAKKCGNVLVAPTLPYGQHSTARNVPGTMDISFDTLRAVISDLLNALMRHGIRRIMIISGHAGTSHMVAVTEACRTIAEKNDVDITFFSDFQIADECGMDECKGDGHAGFIETSRMLHINPELVGKERLKGSYKSFGFKIVGDASKCMPEGVVGDTGKSSAEHGRKINEFIIGEITRMIG